MQNFLRFIDQKKIAVFTLIAADCVFFLLSFFGSYYFRNLFGKPIQPIDVYLQAMPVSFLILVVVFYCFGLYEQKIRIESVSEVYTVSKAVLMTAVLLMAGSFLYKYDYSRGFVLIFIACGLVLMNSGRLFVRMFRKWLIKKDVGLTRVIIIGPEKATEELKSRIKKYESFGYLVLSTMPRFVLSTKADDDHLSSASERPVSALASLIKRDKIDMVFVSDSGIPQDEILEMMAECQNMNVKFKLVSGLYEILAGNLDIHEIEGIPAISMKPKRPNIIYRATKRFIDFAVSLICLIVFAPLWLIIIAGIKIDSPGKAIISQKRVGKDGKVFRMYKFRTMKEQVDLYENAPCKPNDERITKFGKFLRKTSLDESPQFINIIKGDMSLVGPRPEMPFIVERYSKWQRKRLEVKPGLTGLWQILGRKDLPLHENIEYDFYYIKNQSLILDMVILVKTLGVVITGKGAF